jgi:LmbE family N-acetylglucosaminyl deacetylase
MKLFDYDNVLCLSPHPDDVEFSMSGIIKKYEDTNFIILVLTKGTTSDDTSTVGRLEEVRSFWADLGVTNVNLIFTDYEFDTMNDGKWVHHIENGLDLPPLDAIFGTSSNDTHYEHHIVNRILNSLGRNKKVSLFEYKSPSTKDSWEPNLFVDIDEIFDIKLKTLRDSFTSQIDASYFSTELIKQFSNVYNISKLGHNRVESFKTIRKILK